MSIVRTILLVEDNAQDEMLILRALRKVNLGNQVDVVRDGDVIRRVTPGSARTDLEFVDASAGPGTHWYFLRVRLVGDPAFNLPPGQSLAAHSSNSRYPHNLARARGVFAWTSPVWAWCLACPTISAFRPSGRRLWPVLSTATA